MSTRPTEPGNYRKLTDAEYQAIWEACGNSEIADCEHTRDNIDRWFFGLGIPDPDESRAEPAGGLTEDEANYLYRLMVAHSMDTAVSSYRGHPDDPTLESVLSAELARIGFTRLTDAEIAAGVSGYYRAGQKVLSSLTLEQINGWEEKAKPIQVAAFRLAVAEAREAGK